MKLNKIFLGLLGVAAFTMASCSSDDKYEWASVSGPQVFFSDQNPTQFEIDPDGTSFNVPITRADDTSSLTVNLTSTTENSMYSVPSSVTFNAGQKEAYIPVSYDASKIEYGRYDDITITIADAASATPWGIQEFTFKAGVTDWGPWEKWNSAGTATYTYVNFWGGDDPGLPFVYRHNMIKTNLYQFKLSNWGYGVDIIFDYDEETGYVTCAKQWTGYDHSSYGYVYAEDYNAYRAEKDYAPVSSGYGSFDKEQGIITIPLAYVVDAGTFGYDPEYIYIDGYVRADYSLSMAWAGIFTDTDEKAFAVATTTTGADVTEIASVVISAEYDDAAVADAIASGDLEATTSAPGTIYVPIEEGLTGKLQIVSAVVVDGELKSYDSAIFEYYGGGPNPWVSLGTGLFTDNCLITSYYSDSSTKTVFEPQTYEVEILENSDEPGLYRLVNAFEGLTEYLDLDYTPRNLEVNATNPNGVYILEQATGIDDGDGEISIVTHGARYLGNYTVEDLIGYGYLGKLQDGVITFPHFNHKDSDGNVDYTYQGVCYQGDGGWYVGMDGDLKVTLPEAVSAGARAKAKAQAKARDFARRLNAVKNTNHKETKYIRALAPIKD
ncbi:MAG: hypothetical protein IJ580_07510 [Prevotella sp.]|nr:hypothetical protein [Prevotella sp.]MBR1410927.1 hypothetical protein [Prevotella sp.]MBR1556774.1 hypothetical protein [Prevotella sp.]